MQGIGGNNKVEVCILELKNDTIFLEEPKNLNVEVIK